MNRFVFITVAICLVLVQGSGGVLDPGSTGQVGLSIGNHTLVTKPQSGEANPSFNGWVAYLYDGNSLFCSGTIVHEEFILTTGSCLKARKTSNLIVRIGTHDGEMIAVKKTDTLVDYIATDIGLVRLLHPVKFENGIQAAKLADKPYYGVTAFLDYNGDVVDVSVGQCGEGIGDQFVCAQEQSQGRCYGNHGSGLVYVKSIPILIGIANSKDTETNCGSARFTEVSSLKPWISRHTQGKL